MTATARNDGSQNVHYLGKSVTYATVGIDTADTISMGKVPANSRLLGCDVYVDTAFNAASTNVLTVGTSTGSNADIVAGGDVDETVVGATKVLRGNALTFSSDTEVFVKYTQTGTAATAGAAVVVVSYAPPNW